MATRNTLELKKLIMDVMTSDAALQALLGGSGKIRHMNPLQLSEYPCAVYTIVADEDNPYNEDTPLNIARTRLMIQVFSTSTSSKEADAIEDRIYALFNGQKLSNSSILMYTAYRVTKESFYEDDVKVWRIDSKYDLVNVAK